MGERAHDEEILALADRLFAAIEAGDVEAVGACWSDDVVVRTNFAGERDRDTSLRVIGWLVSHAHDLRYEVERRVVLDDGFLQQHVLRATAADGTPVSVPACVVATVTDGRISRIDEYLDPAATAPLAGAR